MWERVAMGMAMGTVGVPGPAVIEEEEATTVDSSRLDGPDR